MSNTTIITTKGQDIRVTQHGKPDPKLVQKAYKIEFTTIGKTKIYVVPPPPLSKEEFDRRLEAVKTAGWAIIQEMQEKNSLSK